jgi:glycerol kinase
MSLVLAIDQSTSATKAVLFTATGKVLDSATREHRQLYPQPGWVEHDAEEIWQNTRAVVRDIALRRDLTQLAGLSLTNQRETIVAFDRETGRPLHNAIVWQCRRGDDLCQTLRRRGCDAFVRVRTGLTIDAYFSASKMAWLINNAPDIAAKLRAGAARLGTIDTYLIHRLTDGAVSATDHTNASRTLLFDIRQLRWDRDLCDLFGVPLDAMPEVRESTAEFGTTDVGGLLPRPVPIVGVVGDSQASLFAQRCYERGATKATLGSGASVLMNVGSDFASHEAVFTALAWVRGGQPTYAFEGVVPFSASTISWLKAQLGMIRDEAEAESLALSVPDNGGVYLVPAFCGWGGGAQRANGARAAILGMSASTRRAHIVRAGLESVAYQLRDVLDDLRASSSLAPERLLVDGGPTRNRFLMQFAADITGTTLAVSEGTEWSAWGAAMAGLLGLGLASRDELAALPFQLRTYRPQMPHADARRLVEGWRASVERIS